MTMKVTHELHDRRWSRNLGLGLVLAGLIAVIFGLTVVKVGVLGEAGAFDQVPGAVVPSGTGQ